MHKREFEKNLWGSRKLPQVHEKVCDENERNKEQRKKQYLHKNVIDGRKPFIRSTQITGENDLNERRISDSGHNEGSYHLFTKRVNGSQGGGFRAWVHKRAPFSSHWLVLRIGCADFLHCWVTDSV